MARKKVRRLDFSQGASNPKTSLALQHQAPRIFPKTALSHPRGGNGFSKNCTSASCWRQSQK
jgi:hypothetical protein